MQGLWPFYATDLSADGSLLIGHLPQGPAIWTEQYGAFPLSAILDEEGVNIGGWTLLSISAVSDDGLTMTGQGINELGDSCGKVFHGLGAQTLLCQLANKASAIFNLTLFLMLEVLQTSAM